MLAETTASCAGWGRPRRQRIGLAPALHSDGRADVAQLVEHFTRNEGVRGSNPRVGFGVIAGVLRAGNNEDCQAGTKRVHLWTPSHLLTGLKDTTGGPGSVRAGHARPPVQPVAAGYYEASVCETDGVVRPEVCSF